MSSLVLPQVPFVITQRKVTVVPAATLVTVVVGELMLTMVAEPEISCHDPVPVVGTLADIKNVLLLHCSTTGGPASAMSGNALLVSTTWSTLGVQVPFSTRHSRVAEVPAGTPVMVVLKAFGLVIVAVPDTTLHVPVPITGSVAAMVKVPSLHCSRSGPATAGDGKAWLVRMMSSNVSAHTPLSMVQRRVAEVPGAIPVMVVDGDEGLVMDAVP